MKRQALNEVASFARRSVLQRPAFFRDFSRRALFPSHDVHDGGAAHRGAEFFRRQFMDFGHARSQKPACPEGLNVPGDLLRRLMDGVDGNEPLAHWRPHRHRRLRSRQSAQALVHDARDGLGLFLFRL